MGGFSFVFVWYETGKNVFSQIGVLRMNSCHGGANPALKVLSPRRANSDAVVVVVALSSWRCVVQVQTLLLSSTRRCGVAASLPQSIRKARPRLLGESPKLACSCPWLKPLLHKLACECEAHFWAQWNVQIHFICFVLRNLTSYVFVAPTSIFYLPVTKVLYGLIENMV